MEMTYQNTLLKVTAILMIVFAVLGLVSAGMISMDVQKELGGSSSGFTSMIMEIAMEDPSFAAQAGIDDPEQFYELMQDEEFQSVMGGVFSFNGLVSLVGGVVLPILYLVGSSQQKKAYLASLSAAQGAGINYAAMPAGSSPKAPPAAPEGRENFPEKGLLTAAGKRKFFGAFYEFLSENTCIVTGVVVL